ncbi:phosphotriesterase [Halanaerobium sp. ST460_2HS_T2]|uniref:phosphotriesterase family protein n=1 Tax=Halanaerobium sp. ST460_2HS_T2 TaxID=2183914 RepID=UPI000DF4A576|nr:phosphotriesterase-related protein [Halanaerobium sp. ST460_2HS_T2]RCW55353.1 phosphotriesterase-related protein [Halanaerobium sp. ST460_2HS_T2]
MKRIQTVKGGIDPSKLGFTYTHEHLVCYPPSVAMKEDPDFELPHKDKALAEIKLFEAAGGGCLVEGTAIDYGRSPEAYLDIANNTSVNIVFTSGFNKGRFYPDWVKKASADELADLLTDEIRNGVAESDIKPGILKCGSWYNVITKDEEKVTRAVARAHLKTGAPIWIHTEAGTMGLEQLDILEDEGVTLDKNVCVGHSDRNADLWYHKKMASRGAYVGYDGPSKVKYYPDSVRVELIKGMFEAGYGEKLLVSGDMGRKSYLKSYGGGPGFEFIIKKFVNRLLDEGMNQEEIDQIWVKNPAEYLAFELKN